MYSSCVNCPSLVLEHIEKGHQLKKTEQMFLSVLTYVSGEGNNGTVFLQFVHNLPVCGFVESIPFRLFIFFCLGLIYAEIYQ